MTDTDRFLQIYVQHHWVGSTGGLDLFNRAAESLLDDKAREQVAALAREVAEDRQTLRSIADRLGVRQARAQQLAARAGEYVGRLKPNGTLRRRSPLSDLVELEALSLGVEGKKRAWFTLRDRADGDSRLDAAQLDELIRRAEHQLDVLKTLHGEAAARL